MSERRQGPVRVTAVVPEPTPYRTPLFDLVAQRPEVELTVVYAADAIAGNRWDIEIGHPHVVLHGRRVPGAARVLRHDYPVTPSVVPLLERQRPDVLVVTGWSTFASQAAVAWARARRVPYVLQVESHDAAPRSAWRRTVKGAIVPRVVRGARGALVTGTLARRSLVAHGADPAHIRVFANTVDTEAFARAAAEARERRQEIRSRLGIRASDVAVLSVARLAQDKGLDTLVRAVARAGRPSLHLVLAGQGPQRTALEQLAASLGVRATFLGAVSWDGIAETYAAADVFALLSRFEPWAVVVVEAAACGLPLVLSDQVGAAHDLLENGRNGSLVPLARAEEGAAEALRELVDDPTIRSLQGLHSAEVAALWGYGASVDGFVDAVVEAAAG